MSLEPAKAVYNICFPCGRVYPHTLKYFSPQKRSPDKPGSICIYCALRESERIHLTWLKWEEIERQQAARVRERDFERFMKRIAAEENNVVYFIQCRRLIKIGTTNNMGGRFEAIQKQLPRKTLHLIGVIRGGHVTERRLHLQFAHLRRFNEWFKATPELTDWILLNAQLVI